ncbi:Rab GTPase [Heterostelium album PN500]|uniref:Rab GTPase n=1 Tax=Heterostelium pallidum (strain ATCC 26659 / Pp 5 / PN500) TaxID=670386 RepID=D3BR97_HETP5|nr:Rab GTPase [Heterostelium album PN500]EFA75929.1 Rab GTPase [Heterostelium album PN500]|eukprot:XP_020428063.1 Rab GTPase [Heterostelium album PN500]
MSKSQIQQQQVIPVKCVMIGPSFAGKTSLVVRLVRNTFENEQAATVGGMIELNWIDDLVNHTYILTKSIFYNNNNNIAMFLNKFFYFEKYVLKFELWDTAGQEKFHSLAPMYFRGAKIAIVVFDISTAESFNKAKSWTREFKSHSTEPAIMVLVGNKCDLERAITMSEAERYAQEEGMIYFEASAKHNTNVTDIFQILDDMRSDQINLVDRFALSIFNIHKTTSTTTTTTTTTKSNQQNIIA